MFVAYRERLVEAAFVNYVKVGVAWLLVELVADWVLYLAEEVVVVVGKQDF